MEHISGLHCSHFGRNDILASLPPSPDEGVAAVSDSEVLVQRVQHGQDGGGDGRGVRLDGGPREEAWVAVDAGHEEGRVGRGAGHHHVVATGEGSVHCIAHFGHSMRKKDSFEK